MDAQSTALNLITSERARQDAKWGEQNHGMGTWLLILMEEVGELSKAALEYAPHGVIAEEAVHVAAVALAICEHRVRIDRACSIDGEVGR